MRGRFITFEGLDGAGKTTQILRAAATLMGMGIAYTQTREPGGTPIGTAIRGYLLDRESTPTAEQETLLYAADRALHVNAVIGPALDAGVWVLCDRFTDSTMAYQGFGRQRPLAPLKGLNAMATAGLVPDLTILLDLDPATRADRPLHKSKDRIEKEGEPFFQRVREGFLTLARWEPHRFLVLDASASEAMIAESIRLALAGLAIPVP